MVLPGLSVAVIDWNWEMLSFSHLVKKELRSSGSEMVLLTTFWMGWVKEAQFTAAVFRSLGTEP